MNGIDLFGLKVVVDGRLVNPFWNRRDPRDLLIQIEYSLRERHNGQYYTGLRGYIEDLERTKRLLGIEARVRKVDNRGDQERITMVISGLRLQTEET